MILAIETSAEPSSIALLNNNKEVIKSTFPNKNQVNIPIGDELAKVLNFVEEPLSCIIVGSGPGSYSGARVGLATAEAIAMVHGCALVTLPSVYGIPNRNATLIGDARRGAYFITSWQSPTPKICNEEEFSSLISKINTPLVTFEKPEKLPLPQETLTNINVVFSNAEGLIDYWMSLSEKEKEELQNRPNNVLYLRPPNITKAKSPF